MELQNISSKKKLGGYYTIFHTLGDEKKVDYQLLDKSLGEIKYDVNIFETFLSPKSKLTKKTGRRKLRLGSLIKNRRTVRNNTLSTAHIKNNSSISLDKIIKKNFFIKKKEEDEKKEVKDVKTKKSYKARNIILNLKKRKKKEDIFITDIRMNSIDNANDQINQIRTFHKKKARDLKDNIGKNHSLKILLPPIKTKNTETNKEELNSIEYVNKMINEDNKNSNTNIKTENQIIKKNNKFISINENAILNMIKRNKRIVNKINTIKSNFENKMVTFEAKYKYINWKYGISDLDKYFIDIDSYKKDSEDLINNKKSLYDKLDDIITHLKEKKELKDLETIKKQYGININKKKDNVDYNSINMNEFEKLFLKGKKVKNILKELYERKKTEKNQRNKIKNILNRSKDRCNIINKNFQSFRMKGIKEMMALNIDRYNKK